MVRFQNFSLVLLVIFLLGKPVTGKGRCTDKCGRVRIQFPFYLKNSKLNHSNLPGFELLCNDKDETLLKLPTAPVTFFVKHIDYLSQQVQIYDPDNCLPSQLLALGNSSVSPFQFKSPDYNYDAKNNVSFFNCATRSCPISQLDSGGDFLNPQLISCTKVRDVLFVEWNIPEWSDDQNTLFLGWSTPECSHCEAQGKKCKLKNNGTQGETECFVCKTNKIPTSTVVLIVAGL